MGRFALTIVVGALEWAREGDDEGSSDLQHIPNRAGIKRANSGFVVCT